MGAHLVLRTEGHENTVVPLDKLPLVLGRGREVDLTLASPLVSRRHCEIYQADERICVRDLESLNGTFVGEDRVDDIELSSGDLLTVGAATFEVVLDDAATPTSGDETLSEEITELDASAFEGFEESSGAGAVDVGEADDSAADEDETEDVSEFSFDFEDSEKSKKKKADKKDEKKPSEADVPTIQVEKGAGSKPAVSGEADEDLDDFLKHFE